MKLFGSTKKLMGKTNYGENAPTLGVFEVVLVQCILLDNQHQQNSAGLYIITPNKPDVYLLNTEPSYLVFLKTHNTLFGEIVITFMDQNGRPLGIEEKVNLTLLISK